MHDSIYIKILENANSSLMSKSRSVVAWGWDPGQGGVKGTDYKGAQGNF